MKSGRSAYARPSSPSRAVTSVSYSAISVTSKPESCPRGRSGLPMRTVVKPAAANASATPARPRPRRARIRRDRRGGRAPLAGVTVASAQRRERALPAAPRLELDLHLDGHTAGGAVDHRRGVEAQLGGRRRGEAPFVDAAVGGEQR